MSIPAIGAVGGFTPMTPQTLSVSSATPKSVTDAASALDGTTATGGAQGADFSSILSRGMENLQGLQTNADQLAVKAATGDLTSIHDYTIAATEASVATQLTTAVRNKALEAFQEIMRMSV